MQKVALASLLLLAVVSGCKKEDYSTPRSAARTFYEAILGGDASVARSALCDDPQRTVIDDLQVMLEGLMACEEAAGSRFGSSGGSVSSKLPSLEDIDGAVESISGESATLTPKREGLKQVRLKRVGGLWKLDLLGSLGFPGKDVVLARQMMRSVGEAAKKVASEIGSGKYASAADAQNALEAGMSQAVLGQLLPQLRPGG